MSTLPKKNRLKKKSGTVRATTTARDATSVTHAALRRATASIPHDDALIPELGADPAFAALYLKAALADGEDPRVLLIALRQVAAAQGMATVARRARIERESLYRALSPRGNPRFSTIIAILRALGLELTVGVSPAPKARRKSVRTAARTARPRRPQLG